MTATKTSVKLTLQSLVYVSNELFRIWIEIIPHRHRVNAQPLDLTYLLRTRESILDGVSTWLISRHLEAAYLEIYTPGATNACERWDITFQYTLPGDDPDEEDDPRGLYATEMARIQGLLGQLGPLPLDAQYRITVTLAPGAPSVPGWKPATLYDVSGLAEQNLGQVAGARAAQLSLVFRG